MTRHYIKKLPEERFWKKVEQTPTCWIWTGSKSDFGHGVFWNGDRLVRAHRFSWEIHFGPIPNGLQVLHRCDNPPCIRPNDDHLFLGTQLDNVRDASAKGRMLQPGKNAGEKNPRAILTVEKVALIRLRYTAGGITQQKLADEYGVTQAVISKAILGATWH